MLTNDDVLQMIKTDLGYMTVTTLINTRLEQYRDAAIKALNEKGVPLDPTAGYDFDDAQLISMYACWLHNKRNSNDGMPHMLRYSLHSRICALHMNGVTTDV